MTEPRLKTAIWTAALIRRAQAAGASAFVACKGDPEAGAVIVRVAPLDGTGQVWSSSYGHDGNRRWIKATGAAFVSDAEAEAYVTRARARDADLWVIEIEDKAGRNFLTEEKE